jgi:tetratricopeptide (TPR) repeat protein
MSTICSIFDRTHLGEQSAIGLDHEQQPARLFKLAFPWLDTADPRCDIHAGGGGFDEPASQSSRLAYGFAGADDNHLVGHWSHFNSVGGRWGKIHSLRIMRLAMRLLSALLCLAASAQTSRPLLSGRLIDLVTGLPVVGARVVLACGSLQLMTSADSRGAFSLAGNADGNCRLRMSADGYQPQTTIARVPVSNPIKALLRPISDIWEPGEYRSAFLPGSKAIVTFFGPDVDLSRSTYIQLPSFARGELPPLPEAFVGALPSPPLPSECGGARGSGGSGRATATSRATATTKVSDLDSAIGSGRLLPSEPDNAIAILEKMRAAATTGDFARAKMRVLTALEDDGQQILLRYLDGDEKPQTKADFTRGASLLENALRLSPSSSALEARLAFFQARALLFDKNYAEANALLEKAVRLSARGAYIYNAMGLGFLEQFDIDRARKAFEDAIRLAPCWAYPRHNLALSLFAEGDDAAAIQAYRNAIRIQPAYAYLYYNLGLAYQRIGRIADANNAYRTAVAISPDQPEALNALGSLYAQQGRRDEAERLYRMALQKNSAFLQARHNLALLLSESRGRAAEAQDLWRQNLRMNPDFLASRLSLAEALANSGQYEQALKEYERVLAQKPEYVAARLAAVDALEHLSKFDEAVSQLQQALRARPNSAAVWERLGDLERSRNRMEAAREAYAHVIEYSSEGANKTRIRRKLAAVQ